MSGTTHVAGPVVYLERLRRIIQRCAVCGEKLEDIRLDNIMVLSTPGAADNGPPSGFAERHLIEVTDGNPRRFLDLGDFTEVATLPENFCLALVEEG